MMAQGLGMIALAATVAAAAAPAEGQTTASTSVVELRQYKIVTGQRDRFIPLFEREFVDSQEALGMRLVGQFRDLDDPNRFVWIREFADMPSREKGLNAFYFGPVWKAHKAEANPMLDDNDNVLLLRPTSVEGDFAARARPGSGTPKSLVFVTIYYLWKDPAEGFATFFQKRLRPELEAAGLPVLASLVPETQPNNFPRLPVRQGEKVFVWVTHAASAEAYRAAVGKFERSPAWRRELRAAMADRLERQTQVLRLEPAPRSALR